MLVCKKELGLHGIRVLSKSFANGRVSSTKVAPGHEWGRNPKLYKCIYVKTQTFIPVHLSHYSINVISNTKQFPNVSQKLCSPNSAFTGRGVQAWMRRTMGQGWVSHLLFKHDLGELFQFIYTSPWKGWDCNLKSWEGSLYERLVPYHRYCAESKS